MVVVGLGVLVGSGVSVGSGGLVGSGAVGGTTVAVGGTMVAVAGAVGAGWAGVPCGVPNTTRVSTTTTAAKIASRRAINGIPRLPLVGPSVHLSLHTRTS
jgi:hypothetical protein